MEIDRRVSEIMEEADRLLRDYPELSFQEAVEKAKEFYGGDGDVERRI